MQNKDWSLSSYGSGARGGKIEKTQSSITSNFVCDQLF